MSVDSARLAAAGSRLGQPHRGWRIVRMMRAVIPENGERSAYAWRTDFDPSLGFTQICTERDFCLRLAPAKPRP